MTLFRLLIFFVFVSILGFSCSDDDSFNTSPDFRLTFSVDTIAFDTLFTGFGSTTKQLKVYNKSGGRVSISNIALSDPNSPYRMNVNGQESNSMSQVEIAKNDSLYIFIEVALLDQGEDLARLLEDKITFETNGNLQNVVLQTYAQDVYAINDDLPVAETLTGDRPYVITKSISASNLTIGEGARLYFKKEAGLHCKGDFIVNGSANQPVYFGSTRLEELYENVPGQWDGIYIDLENHQLSMKHFTIEDGMNGLLVKRSNHYDLPVQLEYGVVKNFTQKGIAVANADFIAHDLLVANCGQACIEFEGEGDYSLIHSTIFNPWYFSPRSASALVVKGEESKGVKIQNCIVWGSRSKEIDLSTTENVNIENSLLRLSSASQEEYASAFVDCIFNEDPQFVDMAEFILQLADNSPAINKGKVDLGNSYPLDLAGNQRDSDEAPDMGAYEFVVTEE